MRKCKWTALAILVCGCATEGSVIAAKNVPIQRVILYRNGVAYFERQGRFEGNALKFGVRDTEVGDFLSSLTVLDRDKGRVQTISFEVPKRKEKDKEKNKDSEYPMAKTNRRTNVRVQLDGTSHDLTISYVLGAPIWRPSYRLVLDKNEALLQAWAVIQNISGEDWKGISLSLTTGAPIAFQSDLNRPVVPERPRVTDTGEVITSVPEGTTALAQDVEKDADSREEAAMQKPAAAASLPEPKTRLVRKKGKVGGRSASMEDAEGMMAAEAMAPQSPPPITADAVQRSVVSMASVARIDETVTQYDIQGKVTVPNKGSTMVAVLSRRIPGEEAHIYAPDPGVSQSYLHPFRAARLKNNTGAMLERGPIAVMGRNSFLGQGVLSPLPHGAASFVPFALDRSVAVESSRQYDEAQPRLVRVMRESVVIERFSRSMTTYKVRNGGIERVKLYARHQRRPGYDLYQPPIGTELTADSALVPVYVAPRGKAELKVEERSPVQRTEEFMSSNAAEAIGVYLRGAAVDAVQGPALKKALAIRQELLWSQEKLRAADVERNEFQRNAEETRANLKAVEKVKTASDLRSRLVKRIAELDSRIEGLTRTIVETQTTISEQRVRLSEALRNVSLTIK